MSNILFIYCNIKIFSSYSFYFIIFCKPGLKFKNGLIFFDISNVFVFLKPQFNNFNESELLRFLVGKPDATAISLLLFFLSNLLESIFQQLNNQFLHHRLQRFYIAKGFLFPCFIGSPPVLSQVNVFSLNIS